MFFGLALQRVLTKQGKETNVFFSILGFSLLSVVARFMNSEFFSFLIHEVTHENSAGKLEIE